MSVSDYLKDIFNRPTKYTKFWISLATAVLTYLSVQFTDATWLQTLIPFAGTFGVFAGTNKGVK